MCILRKLQSLNNFLVDFFKNGMITGYGILHVVNTESLKFIVI